MKAFSDQVERNPDRFVVQELAGMLARVREALAELVQVEKEEIVIVPSASHGINTVLWNIDWKPQDLILVCGCSFCSLVVVQRLTCDGGWLAVNTSYGAVLNSCAHICDRYPGIELLVIELKFPCLHEEVAEATRKALDAVPAGKTVRLGVVDAIASQPVRCPLHQMRESSL